MNLQMSKLMNDTAKAAAMHGAAEERQTENYCWKLHCRNIVSFDVRLDVGQEPIAPLKATRYSDVKRRGPICQRGQFGVFGWSYDEPVRPRATKIPKFPKGPSTFW